MLIMGIATIITLGFNHANAHAKFSCGVSLHSTNGCGTPNNQSSASDDIISNTQNFVIVGSISLVIATALIIVIRKAIRPKTKKKK
jgi:hypothetical protein